MIEKKSTQNTQAISESIHFFFPLYSFPPTPIYAPESSAALASDAVETIDFSLSLDAERFNHLREHKKNWWQVLAGVFAILSKIYANDQTASEIVFPGISNGLENACTIDWHQPFDSFIEKIYWTPPSVASLSGQITTYLQFTFTGKGDYLSREANVQFYRDKISRDEVKQLLNHFACFLHAVLDPAEKKTALYKIDILSPAEKKTLLEDFNKTETTYPEEYTIAALFSAQVERTPDHVALVYGEEALTYLALEHETNRLANYLFQGKGLGQEEPVGILLDRGIHLVLAILATLKAGCAYVPIDPQFPFQRIRFILRDTAIGMVLTEKKYIASLNRLQWECPAFHTFLCLDSQDIYNEPEQEENQYMGQELWEHVGSTATNEITAGGWLSSYTGLPFSAQEMTEYSDNTFKKLQPILKPTMKVLEIGTASGFTMYRIAPYVDLYYGTDLSQVIIDKNEEHIHLKNIKNIRLACLAAHEIEQLGDFQFDLVIINSVIQCFHGHNYLRQILAKAISLMSPTGWIYCGDIMDTDLKNELIKDLLRFKGHHTGQGFTTKTDVSGELFISQGFFRDLKQEISSIVEVSFSSKIHTIANELTRFRYDALLRIDKHHQNNLGAAKEKYQEDARVLQPYSRAILSTTIPAHTDGTAYIIYTSGSTGLPKGVVVPQRGVVSLATVYKERMDITPADRILQFASISFDASASELVMTLLNGATLCLPSSKIIGDLSKFSRFLNRMAITLTTLPPVYLNVLENQTFSGLRLLITAGSAASRELVEKWRHKLQYINAYGPTETSICATLWKAPQNGPALQTVPIGKPFANLKIYILDAFLKLLPVGVAGELCISGFPVARGYLNRPELSAEKFLELPHHLYAQSVHDPVGGKKFYRTGDLARWWSDGQLEFLGRIDQQVKIRGFRIEPGEIENRLLLYHDIKTTIVIAWPAKPEDLADLSAENNLCAYYNTHSGQPLDEGALRAFLAETLPDYMIPAHFYHLSEIPLTPSGKVARQLLPHPSLKGKRQGYQPPQTDTEEKMVALWAEILGINPAIIGRTDNFFHLGGHSLKATLLLTAIHKTFQVKIPMSAFFAAPTVRDLAQRTKVVNTSGFTAIAPQELKEYYPQSSAQKRLYILHCLAPESTAYNVQILDSHRDLMDGQDLESLFKTLIHRHESLRTSFIMINNEPVQKINQDFSFSIEYYHSSEARTSMADRRGENAKRPAWSSDRRQSGATLRHDNTAETIPPAEQEMSVETIVKNFVRPFALDHAPLLRVGLITIRQHRQVLLVDMPHIICDGVSVGILLNELKVLESGGNLPPVKLHYRDFSQWASGITEETTLKSQQQYWLKQLVGPLPVLAWVGDRQFIHEPLTVENTLYFHIHAENTARLKALAREEGATLFMILMGIYNLVLARLCNQEDIIIGTVTAGRKHADLLGIIGVFLNTLAIRNTPVLKKTFRKFLIEVKEQIIAAFDNQDYPFEKLVAQLGVPREAMENPLFDVAFVLQNQVEKAGYVQDVLTQSATTPYHFSLNQVKYQLTLLGTETEQGVQFTLEYDNSRFSPAMAQRIARYFKTAINSVCESPNAKLGILSIIPASERQMLLTELNKIHMEEMVPGVQQTLPALFAQQVATLPDTVAIWGPSLEGEDPVQLSYSYLAQRALQMAQVLIEKGVRPGHITAIMIDRSVEMIIGLLGILTAGSAYLPLDPNYPEDRLQYVLADSAVSCLVTTLSSGNALAKINNWPGERIFLPTPGKDVLQATHLDVQSIVELEPDHPAYIIYTSGTTGRPKGVVIHHGHIMQTLVYRKRVLEMNATFKTMQLFSYVWDGFVASFFTPLLSGAQVFLISEAWLHDLQRICTVIVNQKITHFICVPALFAVILDNLTVPELSSLQMISLAGDVLSPQLISQIREKAPHLELVNEYGVTEAAVCSCLNRHQELDPIIRIGLPNANTRLIILNEQEQLQPLGVAGELCITGDTVARGYLNRPHLTHEKFRMGFDFLAPGSALYKTGDLARRLPDGSIQFLGRIDQQIKIKGFRIEPSEIETQLLSHSQVKEAVVLARQDKNNDKYLCAYYVPKDDQKDTKKPELWPSIAEFFVYDEILYYAMTNDQLRNESYKVAIRRLVKDRVVVEVGTGQDAILSQFCVEAGAAKIYAIEMLADSFQKAQRKIQALGLEDKIILLHGDATQLTLPEKADVLLSEIVGSIGGSEGAAVILNSARRFLKEDGVMIPSQAVTKIAAVYLPASIHQSPAFHGVPARYVDKVFQFLGYPFDLRLCIRHFPHSHVISNHDIFEDLDFTTFTPEESKHQIQLTIDQHAQMDGFLLWLTLETIGGEVIDTLAHEYCWLPVYVPAFYPGIAVQPGDKIIGTCIRSLCENKINPNFEISGIVQRQGEDDISFHCILPHYPRTYRSNAFYQKCFATEPLPIEPLESTEVDSVQLREFLSKRLPPYMIPAYFVHMAALPLTTTGKLDRRALPDPKAHLQGHTTVTQTPYQAPEDQKQQLLVEVWQHVLGIEKISINDDFFTLGGDSIKALQMVSRLQKSRFTLEANRLFLHRTIRELSRFIEPLSTPTSASAEEQGIITGSFPLTPIQVWYFNQQGQRHPRLTQSALLYHQGRWNGDAIQKCLTHLLYHHDALRIEFDCTPASPRQWMRDTQGLLFMWQVFLFTHLNKEAFHVHMEREIKHIERQLDYPIAPLVRVALFIGNEGDYLVFTIHHLVIDGVSWRILLEDFFTLYQQVLTGQEMVLPNKTTSYKQWSQQLTFFAQNHTLQKEIPYWQELDATHIPQLPVDYPNYRGKRLFQNYDVTTLTLSENTTNLLLGRVHRAYHTEINDILLAVIGLTISRWAFSSAVAIALESMGRFSPIKGLNLERTIGWFTTQYPVVLQLSDTNNLALVIKTVKESLRQIPNKGIGYGMLQYLKSPLNNSFSLKPQISFNYLGQFDSEFTTIKEPAEPIKVSFRDSIHPDFENEYLISIEGFTQNNRLSFSFHFHRYEYRRETIEKLVDQVQEIFYQVIQHCLEKEESELTPSDFGYEKMPLSLLPQLLESIKENYGPCAALSALYPLSPMQREMFQAWRNQPGAYFIQNLFSIPAYIEQTTLEKSFSLLVDQYDVLRTFFMADQDGLQEPIQAVLKPFPSQEKPSFITVVDVSHLNRVALEQYLIQYEKEDKERSFVLTRGPLFRLVRFITAFNRHVLLWSLHHSIMDGWCLSIFTEQWIRTYASLSANLEPHLKRVELYRSYIHFLMQQDIQKARVYWQHYLEGYEPVTFGKVSQGLPYQLQEYYFSLGESASQRLRRAAAAHQVTLNTFFQALWGLLLQRYTSANDVVFGAVISGRNTDLKDIQAMLGLFITIIPVRIQTRVAIDFSSLLKQVQQDSLQARFYESAPLNLPEIMALSSSGTITEAALDHPALESILIFENYPQATTESTPQGLQLQLVKNHEQFAYPLCIYIVPDHAIRLRFSYDGHLYDPKTVEKIAADFKEIAGTFS